ncbi:tyrosine-type recombinase/integrase [uncultured Ruegeria sp.]|uniref:tyrosine-type recombinase/integrase n=1 Tax=uncultured Ruegeria sp. TaxID=259304 RepID=UPI0026201849|nr:tyrosine-type recombinase/integrase [uncultured Ruegeria sp.]
MVFLKHQQATKALKTAHRDAQLGAAVIRLLGADVPIKDIDEDTFDHLIAAARAERWPEDHPSKVGEHRNGPRQVHHLWSFLKRCMAHACKKKLVTFNVKLAMLDAPSVSKRGPNVKFASADETRVLVEGLRNGHGPRKRTNLDLADVVQLGFLQALRTQETLGLRWINVHLDTDVPFINVVDVIEEAGGVFRLRTGTKTDAKTGQLGRKVFLLPEAVDLLRRRQGATNNELVFPDHNAGAVWRPSAVSSMVKTAAKNLGVNAGLHSQRHGGITALLEAGVPLEVVSKHAGHANTDMTETTYGWVTHDLAKQQVA